MREFVELRGASGATYRFRAWPESDHHTPTAGNFAVLAFEGQGVSIVGLGVCSDLSRAKQLSHDTLSASSGHLFTRLNVSRAVRDAEHDDLQAAEPAAKTLHHES
ncbi:hypothetical protein ASE17_07725 [Phenylobacterium sp. Root77]|jgi:hypothetical protein|uniref:hypothetical protein n=1 Tax=unclassified Phenylobacterium TaxID=2640670 RepID=UPI0006FD10F3|nr:MULTISPECIES: hypothetical protein [unclassified Phenylobacterium]KQW72851.1 hypothetical protein ASC73_00295 [Phenylobacterium sp. Root1277]KQW92069.1 hypothetical protein ASC79_11005 [Phenylobacterium sp. Root1290]KRC40300.1 hypothetical protein ASE17_07725 [Phenylobacterium sp. Root77]